MTMRYDDRREGERRDDGRRFDERRFDDRFDRAEGRGRDDRREGERREGREGERRHRPVIYPAGVGERREGRERGGERREEGERREGRDRDWYEPREGRAFVEWIGDLEDDGEDDDRGEYGERFEAAGFGFEGGFGGGDDDDVDADDQFSFHDPNVGYACLSGVIAPFTTSGYTSHRPPWTRGFPLRRLVATGAAVAREVDHWWNEAVERGAAPATANTCEVIRQTTQSFFTDHRPSRTGRFWLRAARHWRRPAQRIVEIALVSQRYERSRIATGSGQPPIPTTTLLGVNPLGGPGGDLEDGTSVVQYEAPGAIPGDSVLWTPSYGLLLASGISITSAVVPTGAIGGPDDVQLVQVEFFNSTGGTVSDAQPTLDFVFFHTGGAGSPPAP